MSDIRQTIARVRELDGKATKGPWDEGSLHSVLKMARKNDAWSDPESSVPIDEQNDSALISEYRTLCPALANECERLLEIIESAPHGVGCGERHGFVIKPAVCTCWKSRALAEMEDQTK